MDIRDIIFLRRQQVEIKKDEKCTEKNTQLVASIDADLRAYGYCLSEDLFQTLEYQEMITLVDIHDWLLSIIKVILGANHVFEPMYVNFPSQVMAMSDVALYLNARFHYGNRDLHHLGFMELYPQIKEIKQPRLINCFGLESYKEIGIANEEVKIDVLQNLLGSSVAYSSTDKRDLSVFIDEMNIIPYLPARFVNRENLATIFGLVYKEDNFKLMRELAKHVRTATDVLRIQVAMCDGDVSLATPSKFKSISRKYRRFLLSLYEEVPTLGEDFSLRKEYFKKAFEYLHADEYRKFYPKTSEAINKIRDGVLEKTYYGKVEAAIQEKDVQKIVALLSEQPGFFARKLDEILRKNDDATLILETFEKVAVQVNVRILFTIREHFKARMEDQDYRVFFPKGNTAKAAIRENELMPMRDEVALKIIEICEKSLCIRLSQKESMGKVYIDEELKNYKAPMVLRNLSEGSKFVTRGSRLPFDVHHSVLRGFIWWKDDCDIDLSVVFFDENWEYIRHISYTDLKNSFGCHSGDITYQRGISDGECEFVDVNLIGAYCGNARYAVLQVHSFSRIDFSQANCLVGYMERTEQFVFDRDISTPFTSHSNGNRRYPNTGEIFEPKTVKSTMQLSQDAKTVIPWIFDIEKRQMIWADIAVGGVVQYQNVESTLDSSLAACYAVVNNHTPTLYDVLYFNALARGEIVETKEEADVCFTKDKTPHEIDRIVADFVSE